MENQCLCCAFLIYKGENTMRHRFRRPVHLKKYCLHTAAVLKGIAAVFYPTKICIKQINTLTCNRNHQDRTCDFFRLCGFLFGRAMDKPCFIPRSRSPPPLPSQERNPRRKGKHMNFDKQKIFFQTVQVLLSLVFIIGISSQQKGGDYDESRRS